MLQTLKVIAEQDEQIATLTGLLARRNAEHATFAAEHAKFAASLSKRLPWESEQSEHHRDSQPAHSESTHKNPACERYVIPCALSNPPYRQPFWLWFITLD
jgi:hypothetical protein